jgi:hypothetical protein
MSRDGGHNVYELLKDKVVWHSIERDNSDYPSDSYPVIAEGFCFSGIARFGYNGWTREEGGGFICSVKRWAKVPDEIWHAYINGYFEPYRHRAMFQSEEEFNQFKDKALHICGKDLPEGAEVVGDFDKDNPYNHYKATIYYKDNQYYMVDGCKEYARD